jgi:hypothetical protein
VPSVAHLRHGRLRGKQAEVEWLTRHIFRSRTQAAAVLGDEPIRLLFQEQLERFR